MAADAGACMPTIRVTTAAAEMIIFLNIVEFPWVWVLLADRRCRLPMNPTCATMKLGAVTCATGRTGKILSVDADGQTKAPQRDRCGALCAAAGSPKDEAIRAR
jgi:hypothetical protein